MDRHSYKRGLPRLTDEELEYYGDLYIRYQIHAVGVDFESFLIDPEYFLRKYGRWCDEDERRRRRRGLLGFLRLRHASRTPSG